MAFSLGIFRRDRYSSISSCGLLFTRDAYFVYFLHSTQSPVSVNTCSNVTIILIPNWINPLQIQVSAKEIRPLPKPNYRRNPRSAKKPRPNASFAFHWYVNRTSSNFCCRWKRKRTTLEPSHHSTSTQFPVKSSTCIASNIRLTLKEGSKGPVDFVWFLINTDQTARCTARVLDSQLEQERKRVKKRKSTRARL